MLDDTTSVLPSALQSVSPHTSVVGFRADEGEIRMDTDITCPHCHSLDLVQSVPALHADGVSTSFSSANHTGVGISTHGFVPVIGTSDIERTNTSALVRALPLGPREQPLGTLIKWGLLLLIPALLFIAPTVATVADHPLWKAVISASLSLGCIAAPAGIVLLFAALRARDNAKIRRGRPAAWAVWSSAWYCHRCGLAYWPVSPAPSIPARQGFAPGQFQWFVWSAGHYARA
ncbi:hypothetical protein [Nocardia fusca]|uniref:hypothetical protein n=1 Tax=Nocardia fusca TaxID=941183 RepID=UPI0007A764C2|nr:hypothetical protein [Nocardia fusca]